MGPGVNLIRTFFTFGGSSELQGLPSTSHFGASRNFQRTPKEIKKIR